MQESGRATCIRRNAHKITKTLRLRCVRFVLMLDPFDMGCHRSAGMVHDDSAHPTQAHSTLWPRQQQRAIKDSIAFSVGLDSHGSARVRTSACFSCCFASNQFSFYIFLTSFYRLCVLPPPDPRPLLVEVLEKAHTQTQLSTKVMKKNCSRN